MGSIKQNIDDILGRMRAAQRLYGVPEERVRLLCVTKTKPVSDIMQAYEAGQRLFGESYANEAGPKIEEIRSSGIGDIRWHFIGPIQTNKIKHIANVFDVVESVDRPKVAQMLNDKRDPSLGPLEVLVQVNISGEGQKSGVDPAGADGLIALIRTLPNLRLRGLMGIALETDDASVIEAQFESLRGMFGRYAGQIEGFDQLSMGMTHDLEIAIKCGSTQIRIGTAIFGPREYRSKA